MDIAQFGQTVKQKYPEYQDMDDADLGQKMLSKYPQYQDMVTAPTQPVQPQQHIPTGLGIGLLKGAGSTLESGVRSTGQILGGMGGAISVPIQERRQADLTTQYEQALQNKNTELARQIQTQINQAGKPSQAFSDMFDNPFLAKVREALKPKTTAEKIGYGAEKIGEIMITGGAGYKGAGASQALFPSASKSLVSYGDELLGATKALPRIAGAMVKNIPSGISTSIASLAQEGVKDDTRTGAVKSIGKPLIAGATDVLLSGVLQSAKEVFGAGKKAMWRTAIPPDKKKQVVREIIDSEKKWDNVFAPQKQVVGDLVEEKSKKATKEVVADWYAQNAPAGSSTELAGWSKSYMKNKIEPNLQQVVKNAPPVKADKKFINTLLDNLEEGYNETLEPEKLKVVQELKRQLNTGLLDIKAGEDAIYDIGENAISSELALRLKRLFGGVAYEKGFQQMSKMTPKRQAFAKMAGELRKELGKSKEIDNLIGMEEKLYDGFNSLVKSVGKEITPAQGLFGFYDLPALTGTFVTGRPEVLALNELLKQGGRLSRTTGFKTRLANMLGGASKNIAPESLVGQVIRKSSANAIND